MSTSTTMRSNFLPKDSFLINALKCCANCNKESEPFTLKMCPECRTAHYCNADCQQADREHHQHQCIKDAQKLKEEIERVLKPNHTKESTDNDDDNDDELFQPIPPEDDCPICTFPLPLPPVGETRSTYYSCCGKTICTGCYDERLRVTLEQRPQRKPPCPFCREPTPTSYDENVTRIKKRMEVNDSKAILMASYYYKDGKYGLPKDPKKSFDLCLRAADLGHAQACHNVAVRYNVGVGVAKNMEKSMEYWKMAAKKGDIKARHSLGAIEWSNGNYRLACRHHLISAAAGHAKSLTKIARCYQYQLITKEEYSTALTSYNNVYKNEHSIERERSAAVRAELAIKYKRQKI